MAEQLNLMGMSNEELHDMLEKLQTHLRQLEDQEPEDERSEGYDRWVDAICDLEEHIDQVEDALGGVLMAYGQGTPVRKSVVEVYFPSRNMTLAYYNDRFDLHRGDLVYVDGKLEGKRGRVVDVNYNFKIKLSDYKRVVALVDTKVSGEFFMAGSHFVTFDSYALPPAKVRSWFRGSVEDEEYVSGSDGTSFRLDQLTDMKVSAVIAERGREYYIENKVKYICVNETKGYAIVEGSEPYEVEFTYREGEISDLTCSCFCSYNCKHEVAAMLQLKEMLERIGEFYAEQYDRANCFAAIAKSTLFEFVITGKESGKFIL